MQVPDLISGGYLSRLLLLLLAAHERNKLLAPIWMTTSLVGLPKKSHRSQSANNNNTKISLQNFHLLFPKIMMKDWMVVFCKGFTRIGEEFRLQNNTCKKLKFFSTSFWFWWLNSKLVAAAISETLRLSSLY